MHRLSEPPLCFPLAALWQGLLACLLSCSCKMQGAWRRRQLDITMVNMAAGCCNCSDYMCEGGGDLEPPRLRHKVRILVSSPHSHPLRHGCPCPTSPLTSHALISTTRPAHCPPCLPPHCNTWDTANTSHQTELTFLTALPPSWNPIPWRPPP